MVGLFGLFGGDDDEYTNQIPEGNQRQLFNEAINASDEWDDMNAQDKQGITDVWLEAMDLMSSHTHYAFHYMDNVLEELGVTFDASDWDTFRENYHP